MPVQSVDMPSGHLDVALRLEEARRRQGFRSWAEVARRSGIRPTSLSQLVTGKVRVTDVRLGTLVKLATVLDVTLDELVEITPTRSVPSPRADRPITDEEFAEAVAAVLSTPVPSNWTGPSEEDMDEVGEFSILNVATGRRVVPNADIPQEDDAE